MLWKDSHNAVKQRSRRGSLIAENAGVLYLLFFFLFFPLLDLGAMGLRTFFLWFACNQAAMAGSKGTKWSAGNLNSADNYSKSIQTQGTTTAQSVVAMFSGITMNAGYPRYTVILRAIQHSDTDPDVNQTSATTVTYPNGSGLPLTTPVDTSQYVPILRVQLNGIVQPFIRIPFPLDVPGLTTSFPVSIVSDQQIENANALSS